MGRGRATVPIDFPFLLGGNCSRIGNVVDAKKKRSNYIQTFCKLGGRCHSYISFPVIWNLSHNMIYFFAALMIITSFQKIKL